jgi:hypothetical protein
MKVFISHSQQDQKLADSVRERLRTVGHEVWDPEHDLLPGDNWLKKTGRALEQSDAVIFLLSPEGAQSPNILKEIEYTISNRKFKGRILPVVFQSASKSVPWILKKINYMELPTKVSNTDKAADSIVNSFAAVI